jgi:hypothetical protein
LWKLRGAEKPANAYVAMWVLSESLIFYILLRNVSQTGGAGPKEAGFSIFSFL